jgi:hypothetical protein
MFSTATNLAGPWSELKLLRTDPPSPDSYNTQHDFVLTVAGSEVTTHVYVGDRYSQWTQRGSGRNIFLPLVWQGREPVLRWCNTWSIDTATGRFTAANGDGADRLVRDAAEFRQAVSSAKPGTRIRLAPGTYPGGFDFRNLRGTANQPIVIAGADPDRPPVFQGGTAGLHFSNPMFVELKDLVITNMIGNGLNIDDGGSVETPARRIVLRRLRVSDIGPGGNNDAIKLSGVVDFCVEGCVIQRWGTGGGSGIDMVGCHRGVIQSNRFCHTDSTGSTGVQAKGGTSQIAVRRNRFENAGGRAVNIGGSTGRQFFRPALQPGQPHWEAKDILVEGNTFIGSGAPVAFVGVDGAVVRFNTIYDPQRWALRILQETQAPDFVPSRRGWFSDNLVAFRSSHWAEGGVNVGPGTAPQTFQFARNWWYCQDEPARSRPRLPVEETGGVYGRAPLFRDAPAGDFRLEPGSPARIAGAEALADSLPQSPE